MRNLALTYLVEGEVPGALEQARRQLDEADNMTDRQGALMVLCGLQTPLRDDKLAAFHQRFAGNALVRYEFDTSIGRASAAAFSAEAYWPSANCCRGV